MKKNTFILSLVLVATTSLFAQFDASTGAYSGTVDNISIDVSGLADNTTVSTSIVMPNGTSGSNSFAYKYMSLSSFVSGTTGSAIKGLQIQSKVTDNNNRSYLYLPRMSSVGLVKITYFIGPNATGGSIILGVHNGTNNSWTSFFSGAELGLNVEANSFGLKQLVYVVNSTSPTQLLLTASFKNLVIQKVEVTPYNSSTSGSFTTSTNVQYSGSNVNAVDESILKSADFPSYLGAFAQTFNTIDANSFFEAGQNAKLGFSKLFNNSVQQTTNAAVYCTAGSATNTGVIYLPKLTNIGSMTITMAATTPTDQITLEKRDDSGNWVTTSNSFSFVSSASNTVNFNSLSPVELRLTGITSNHKITRIQTSVSTGFNSVSNDFFKIKANKIELSETVADIYIYNLVGKIIRVMRNVSGLVIIDDKNCIVKIVSNKYNGAFLKLN